MMLTTSLSRRFSIRIRRRADCPSLKGGACREGMPGFARRQAGISLKTGQTHERCNKLKYQSNIFKQNFMNYCYFNML
jgi:hypothetical protein